MSRYAVDKVMRETLMYPQRRETFLADPAAYLEGRDLTDEERTALSALDYATLYKLGAHPFLLFGWAVRAHKRELRSFVQEYKEAIKPYGYPDYGT